MLKEDVSNTPLVYGFNNSKLSTNCLYRQRQNLGHDGVVWRAIGAPGHALAVLVHERLLRHPLLQVRGEVLRHRGDVAEGIVALHREPHLATGHACAHLCVNLHPRITVDIYISPQALSTSS